MADCNTNLADIKLCVDSAGGNASGVVKTLKVAFKPHVTSIPDPDAGTHLVSGDIVMSTDTRTAAEILADDPTGLQPGVFYDIDLREEGLQYTAEADGNEEDGNMVHTLSGRIPKMSALKNHILDGMRGGNEHILVFTDRNRFTQLMGDTYEGVTVSVVPTTDGNGYNVTFTWRSARLMYGYTGAVAQA